MKILLADDHSLFRAGLRHLLAQLEDGESVEIEEAEDHAAVVEVLEQHTDIALVLLDLRMPGVDGIAALEALRQRYPSLPVVVMSASDDRTDMQRSLDKGALGFIPKSTRPAVILNALRLVLSGGVYVPPALVQGIPMPPATDATPARQLTQRQSAVLALIVEGKSNKVIAATLGLTEATVKAHVTAVFKALGFTNRLQAIIAGKRGGTGT